jgi:hypothetical protein
VPPGQQPPPAWGAPPPPGYGYQPPAYGYGPAPRTDGTAIAALILSIASFVVCPVIPAIVALALCPSSRRRIEASRGALTGEGMLTAAKVVSWVNLGLSALAITFFVIAGVAGWFDEDPFYYESLRQGLAPLT